MKFYAIFESLNPVYGRSLWLFCGLCRKEHAEIILRNTQFYVDTCEVE